MTEAESLSIMSVWEYEGLMEKLIHMKRKRSSTKKFKIRRLWVLPLPAVIVMAVVILGGVGIIGALNGWFGGGGSIPSDTFTRGLVGYWNFDEGSGIKATDASGNGNHGTLTYMATNTDAWTSGKVGGALQFDGNDDYVNVGNVGNVRTVEFWVNNSNASDGILELINDATHISISGSAITAAGLTSPTIYVNGSSASASLVSGWNHVVITADAISAASFRIGEANDDFLSGKIDEVKLYSRALSAAEIRYHYNRGGPVAYWKFDEGNGTTTYDSTDNNNDGIMYNMSTSTSGGWVAGKYGSALEFDGVDDYVEVLDNTVLDITDAVTLEAWVYDPPLESGSEDSSQLLNFGLQDKYEQATEIKNKYSLNGVELVKVDIKNPELDKYNGEPKDEVKITLGDKDKAEFVPNIELSRWREVLFKIKTDNLLKDVATKDKNLSFNGDKIKFDTPKISFEMYDYTEGEGGYKFVWFLNEKPVTNKVEFQIESSGLDFFYQPELTQAEIDEGAVRPENVVGSYAVYHSGNPVNYVGGKEYKTGKAFHIYRPHIIDTNGTETWGILNIENGIYSVEIPQEFLDTAVYPIKSNDTFGYTGVGESSDSPGINSIAVFGSYSPATNGIATDVTVYGIRAASASRIRAVLYLTDNTLVSYGAEYAPPSGAGWRTLDFTDANVYSASSYNIGIWSNSTSYNEYYDSVAGYYKKSDAYTYHATNPPVDPLEPVSTTNDRQYSIYATYTASGGAGKVIVGKGQDAYQLEIDSNLNVSGYINGQALVTAQITKAWHYLALSYDRLNVRLYVDGVEKDSYATTSVINTNSTNLKIGELVPGKIDDVRIYNYARTPDEIRLDYNAGFGARFGPSSDCDRDPGSCMTQGLVGYWNFDEGSGTKATDASGNGNHGTLTYMATNTNAWTTGKVGSALQFDGTDDNSSIGNVGSVQTIEFWLNNSNATDGVLELIDDNTYISLSSSAITLTNFTNAITYINGNVNTTLASGWNHVVITADAISAASFRIGEANDDFLSGKIDEVKLYSRALSAAEIRYHYNRGGPVAQWKMDEGEGRTVYDSTDNNNDGTLVLAGSATSSAWVSGKYGGALSFDGTDDYVKNSTADWRSGDSQGTISAWIKTGGNLRAVFSSSDEAATNKFFILRVSSSAEGNVLSISQRNADTADQVNGFTNLGDNAWHFITLVSDGSIWKMFIDGKEEGLTIIVGSNTGDWFADTANRDHFLIGARQDSGGFANFFDGTIDDVRIYNYARTPEEIRLDYNAGFGARFGPSSDCDRDPGACMTQGLVSYWPMDEGSGIRAYDGSDYGNNGTLTYMVTNTDAWTGGKVGGALSFDGTDDYVNAGNNSVFNITNTGTMMAWVKGGAGNVVQKGGSTSGSASSPYWMQIWTGNKLLLHVGNSSDYDQIATNKAIDTTVWNFVAITLDGATKKLYINGVNEPWTAVRGTGTRIPNTNTQSLYIGRQQFQSPPANYANFNGLIDDVRIYNRALSDAEVRYHYNRGDPVAQWKFDEGEGRTIYDSTDNNNDGTLVLAGSATSSAWVAGKYGSAINLDGTDDYVDAGNVSANARTISFWVKRADTSDKDIIDLGTPEIKVASNALTSTNLTSPTYYVDGIKGTTLTANVWHHVAIIDTADISASNVDIGKGINNYFYGLIDDVRIYNYARTPEEIRLDYNAGFSTHFK